METVKRFLKFGLVGGSGVVVNQTTFMVLCTYLMLPIEFASPIAIAVAITTNFLLNYFWTWRERSSITKIKHIFYTYFRFFIASALTAFCFNYLPLLGMHYLLDWNKDVSNVLGIGVASVANFLISNYWTFRKTNVTGQ